MTVISTKTGRDERGFLIEYLTNKELKEMGMKFGLIYVTSVLPNKFRGNHYHKKKSELITCIHGKVKVVLFDTNTKEKQELILDSSEQEIKRLLVKPEIAHLFENNSDETAVLIAHTSEEEYDREDDFKYILS